MAFPSDWQAGRIGDLVTSVRNGIWGGDPVGPDDGVWCVRGADFDRVHHRVDTRRLPRRRLTRQQLAVHGLQYGDLVLEKSGGGELQLVGAAAMYDHSAAAVCSNFAARVRPAGDVDPRFLSAVLAVSYRYALNSPAIKQTTGIQNLDASQYLASAWGIPRAAEQGAIADAIERADALLTSAERRLSKVRLIKAGLSDDLLRGGGESSADGAPAWLGAVGRDWDVRPLRDVLDRNDSGVWGSDPGNGDGFVVLRSTDIAIDGRWTIESPAVRRLSARERREARLAVGDLLMTKSSGSVHHLGKTALVTDWVAALDPCFSNFTQRLRTTKALEPRYLFHLLNSPRGRRHLVYLGTTSTGLANLNAKVLGAMAIPCPSIPVQRRIADALDLLDQRIEALVEIVRKRTELRNGLMDDLVLGRVRHPAFVPAPEAIAS